MCNTEGKVTLPSGSFVSCDVPGQFLKYRIDEWHRRHPGQLILNGLMVEITPHSVALPRASHTVPRLHFTTPTAEILDLRHRTAYCISMIERELQQLRHRM
jgi:hypothetical protein